MNPTGPLKLAAHDRRHYHVMQFFRLMIGTAIILFISYTIELGTRLELLLGALVAGIYISGYLISHRRSFLRVLITHLVIFAFIAGALSLWNVAVVGGKASPAENDFLVFRVYEQLWLAGVVYLLSFISTWWFWSSRIADTIEGLLSSAVFIWLLSGHRNYQLDAPKKMSELAWDSGVSPQHLLLALGALFFISLVVYFVLAHHRPLFSAELRIKTAGKPRKFLSVLIPAGVFLYLVMFAVYVNSVYSSDLSRATEGVGMDGQQEGESPLGFHSALGQSKQPAALVRLEGNYDANPWAPMLYLREGALSRFNGREFVLASREFDQDVPQLKPGQPFIALEKEINEFREKLTHSIYLLTEHKAPFAVDYPVSVSLIKNPDQDRFKLAYQALSHAPVIKLDQIIGNSVGSSAWDDKTWEHYLRAPGSLSEENTDTILSTQMEAVLDEHGEDLRYAALARELTKDAAEQVLKAATISQFLSDKSIYTRKPGHQVTQHGDPVSAYLFADEKRGYCVHFAHAAAYLMRLVGIPARIGTGYLTDLTYAKDGHILLHLGDRHAWPEIYVEGYGWVVVDVTPAQAENEQVIIPDEGLLEDLMNSIDPTQELVTPPPLEPEKSFDADVFSHVFNYRVLGSILTSILLAFLAVKSWLRYGYYLPAAPRAKLQRAYTSCASLAADVGLPRRLGETRNEYASRLKRRLAVDAETITRIHERSAYRGTSHDAMTTKVAVETFAQSYDSSRTWWKRFISFFSPLSLWRIGKW